MGHKTEITNVSCKVLPICDANSTNNNDNSSDENDEQGKNERKKSLTRMKKLLKWAAAVKNSQRAGKAFKVLQFGNKLTLKARFDNSSTASSPKISFRWDATSCSTVSAVYSPLSLVASTSGNDQTSVKAGALQNSENVICGEKVVGNLQWITTDDEYVVLEL